jgi:Bacteriophage tail sheath protein
MRDKDISHPGVFVEETNPPHSIPGVPTSVPAIIGYTERASINGKSTFNEPVKVSSLAEFETYFGGRYNPPYNIHEQPDPKDDNYDFRVEYSGFPPVVDCGATAGSFLYYSLQQATASRFCLYDSMRLFYGNGGGDCYIVSVGDYAKGPVVQRNDLLAGLNVIRSQQGTTMLVVPDAVLLDSQDETTFKPSAAFQAVVREMLKQCGELADRIAILDVYGARTVCSQATLDAVINQFRIDVGDENLKSGVAYFPPLHTSVVTTNDFTYQNLQPLPLLQNILSWENYNLYYASDQAKYLALQDKIKSLVDPPATSAQSAAKLTQDLAAEIPLFAEILGVLVEKNCVLTPSAALAGVYTYIDATRGVWSAPANIDLNYVDRTSYKLTDDQQNGLNAPVDGKAVNAIREFAGRGPVVWGARTLDGNSSDWRYISVRRTVIYLEQSIKGALETFVTAPNNGNTWVAVVSMISNFLTDVWRQGGIQGAKPQDAFSVATGLGSTMTAEDILNGVMIVQVQFAPIRPAEFVVLTFTQRMTASGDDD